MALLTKDQILSAEDQVVKDVGCPEWGGVVRLRSLTGTERDAFEGSIVSQVGGDRKVNLANLRAKLVAKCAIGDDGKQLFSEADVKKLGAKNAAVLDRLFDAARRLSGLTQDDVEELAEGLGDAQSDGSTSA